jgi:AcrR family transcriptional regulator
MNDVTQPPRRYKGYEETHQLLIEVAVRLIAERGMDSLSLSALARAADVNRTTVYYHFADRDALVAAVKNWSATQIVRAFNHDAPQAARIDHITRFVLENPELTRLWIEDLTSAGDMRDSYPQWDELVAGMARHFAAFAPEEQVDAEIYSVQLLAAALAGPLVFRLRVDRKASNEEIMRRFRHEQQRVLRRDGLLNEEEE